MGGGEGQPLDEPAGKKTRTARVRINVSGGGHLSNGAQGPASECRQQRVCECDEGHHCGQGISRKSDDEATIGEFGQDGRVAGAHSDAVQQQAPTEGGHGGAEMICP
jgi:hypothetical protein